MLTWYKYLYVGDNAKKNIEKYRKHLDKGRVLSDVYVITLAANQVDQLDVMNSYYLLQDTLYRRCPLIVGITEGADEARQLVIQMLQETYEQTGTGNIKDYLMQR